MNRGVWVTPQRSSLSIVYLAMPQWSCLSLCVRGHAWRGGPINAFWALTGSFGGSTSLSPYPYPFPSSSPSRSTLD